MITNTTPPTLSGSTTHRVVTSHDHKHNTTHTLRVYNTQGGYITWSHSQGLQHTGWLHHMITNTTPPTLSGSTTHRVVTSHDHNTPTLSGSTHGYITWSQTQHHPHSQGLQHTGWLHHMITNITPPTLVTSHDHKHTTHRVVTSHAHKHNTTHTLRVYNTQGGYITWSQT